METKLSGVFTITNARYRNRIKMRNNNDAEPLICVVPNLSELSQTELWRLVPSTDNRHQIKNMEFNYIASIPPSSKIETHVHGSDREYWWFTEKAEEEKSGPDAYFIRRGELCWHLVDKSDETPVRYTPPSYLRSAVDNLETRLSFNAGLWIIMRHIDPDASDGNHSFESTVSPPTFPASSLQPLVDFNCANDAYIEGQVHASMRPAFEIFKCASKCFQDALRGLIQQIRAHSFITMPSPIYRTVLDIDLYGLEYATGVGVNILKQCHPGSRREVLSMMQDWVMATQEEAKKVFWLSGMAGTGKQQWTKLIMEPIKEACKTTYAPVLVVLDALDESGAEDTRELLLQLLSSAAELPPNIRILITSRPLPDIRDGLRRQSVQHFSLDSVPPELTRHDMEQCIAAKLGDLRIFQAEDYVALARKSNGVFEWARLSCEYITGRALIGSNPRIRYNAVTAGISGTQNLLDDMYKLILTKAMQEDERMNVLAFRARRISLTDSVDVELVIDSLGAVLTGITDNKTPIRPLHASFYDFLIDEGWSGEFFRFSEVTCTGFNLSQSRTTAAAGPPLQGHIHWVRSVAISHDGQIIVSGSADKTIRVWDANTGRQLGLPLRGHTQSVRSAAISHDGQQIVSSSGDNTVRIWDVGSGRQVGSPLEGHTAWVTSVAISPDEQRIVSGSDDMTIRGGSPPSSLIPDEEGWVVGPKGQLLLWVPIQLVDRSRIPAPGNISVFLNNMLQLDLSQFTHGEAWNECYDPDGV
ncbi:uncharacterized protein FIBRA_04580 [Fibroporia radiculosa]|uniref:Nephrocystin 3-like N-terminal domain-containing protein n=1 Tax=Fibroporia radiculosa TaxID=599839 RepID=J4GPH4_9APHY|nr:uncharacterized protein FIBRA_04580 [Fibroporia radiculosa]CCM02480.1 predicted protein [Fibroporia radiculosa]